MIRLDDLALFVRSAALGGFSGAAREADLLPGQVSAAIGRLERALDVRLFARSTRSLRLTAEGERYLPYAQEALQALRDGEERLHSARAGELRGLLQISAPSDFGRNVLLAWLAAFRREHPALQLRLVFSDHVSDVFREPVDVAFRYSPGTDASFIALPLAPENRRVLVASPAYLERRGAPANVQDLARHDCLPWTRGDRAHDLWTFTEDGERRQLRVRAGLQAGDGDIARRLALEGEGIAYKSWLDVAEDVRAGRLVRLLPQVLGEPAPLHLVCPHRKQFSPAVQRLHARVRERCDALSAEG